MLHLGPRLLFPERINLLLTVKPLPLSYTLSDFGVFLPWVVFILRIPKQEGHAIRL